MNRRDDPPRPILIAGGTGQIGFELIRQLSGIAVVVAPSRLEMDLTNSDQIRKTIRALSPGVIVNAAAYTAVDRAESYPDIAQAINADAPALIAAEAKLIGAAVVHYSTDYVFDGAKGTPYREDDNANPLSVYGSTKLCGEAGVKAAGGASIIFRTSWVYSLRGQNFLRTMLRLAEEKSELRIVDDQHGSPTWAAEIARATVRVLAKAMKSRSGSTIYFGERAGVYHLTASGSTSWFGFARAIFAHHGKGPELLPVTSAEYPAAARRPRNSVLDNSKAKEIFGLELPPWETQLNTAMAAET